jgi:outer membrane lipoprotein-sorting protein
MRPASLSVRLLAALCVWSWATASVAAAQTSGAASSNWGVAQLMRALRQVKAASGTFTERKTLHMLSAPLVSSGTLNYVAPDRMSKMTLSPRPERLVLDGDRVTMKTGPDGETHTFSVTEYPQIGGLVEGIRATLAGDLSALDRYYTVQLTGSASDWQLRLLPRDPDLEKLVKLVRIQGREDRILTVETDESDGDRSVMTVAENIRDTR